MGKEDRAEGYERADESGHEGGKDGREVRIGDGIVVQAAVTGRVDTDEEWRLIWDCIELIVAVSVQVCDLHDWDQRTLRAAPATAKIWTRSDQESKIAYLRLRASWKKCLRSCRPFDGLAFWSMRISEHIFYVLL